MKQPLFKRLLSYLFDQHIESVSSDINPELYLLLVKGRYQLVTDKVIYSFEDKYDNFFDVFRYFDFNKRTSCLILGFGLGSIPTMLEKSYKADLAYTGIEIDEEIVYLASKYVLDELQSPVDLIQADAGVFVEICEEQYDLICVDLFINDEIPEEFKTADFMDSCKQLLTANGVLVFNSLYLTKNDRQASRSFYNDVFKNEFPMAKAYHCGNNLMLVSSDPS